MPADGEENPLVRFRTVSPGCFDALGVRLMAGRDFNDADRQDAELAIGSAPRDLLASVLREGALIAGIGIVAGALGGIVLARVIGGYVEDVRIPGLIPIIGAAMILVVSAIVASLMPAARAARVDVAQALRPE